MLISKTPNFLETAQSTYRVTPSACGLLVPVTNNLSSILPATYDPRVVRVHCVIHGRRIRICDELGPDYVRARPCTLTHREADLRIMYNDKNCTLVVPPLSDQNLVLIRLVQDLSLNKHRYHTVFILESLSLCRSQSVMQSHGALSV